MVITHCILHSLKIKQRSREQGHTEHRGKDAQSFREEAQQHPTTVAHKQDGEA